jgi:hypothetical protein
MASIPDQTLAAVRTISRLAQQPDLRAQPFGAVHLIMTMRLRAIFERAERDPIAELSARLCSVPAAIAALELCDQVCAVWPEAFAIHRPCCVKLTPDEHTLALMAHCARGGDRTAFSAVLDGFVRTSRHDNLFDATVRALAMIPASNPRG